MADQVVERFANSRGNVRGFPSFVSMEVLRSERADEFLEAKDEAEDER